jgi:hypothetical protein
LTHTIPHRTYVDVVVYETIVLPVATLFMNVTFFAGKPREPSAGAVEILGFFNLSAPLLAANYCSY